MNSGQWGFYGGPGGQGAMAPGPALLVAQKGPARKKKLKRNHRKTFEYTLEA